MYTIKCFVAYFACPFCKLVGTMIGSTFHQGLCGRVRY
jgi:phosphotransferase system  glucose/maltose/N-acetylglucosamine-specific IIC component